MFDFTGQKIVVTGGTRGIGRGISQAFLNAGGSVIATYLHNKNAADEFLAENEKYKDRLFVRQCDVRSEKQVEEFFSSLSQEFGEVQVLINNSGVRADQIAALMSEGDWDKVINTNLNGTFRMTKQAILHFMPQRYGRIVNITSIGGKMGLPGQCNYAASKAAQEAMSRSVAKEVAKKKITINNVAPGFIDTDLISDLPVDQLKAYKKSVPMNRFGSVQDVANAVLFLAARESSYITGTTIEVTGGL